MVSTMRKTFSNLEWQAAQHISALTHNLRVASSKPRCSSTIEDYRKVAIWSYFGIKRVQGWEELQVTIIVTIYGQRQQLLLLYSY